MPLEFEYVEYLLDRLTWIGKEPIKLNASHRLAPWRNQGSSSDDALTLYAVGRTFEGLHSSRDVRSERLY